MAINLTPEKAFIFRITHRRNVRWLLENGLHCRNSKEIDPNFVSIGNQELIDRRHMHPVPRKPHGTLSDYVPFYFTPLSPMLYNIKTGWGGIRQRNNDEIAIVVSSLRTLEKRGTPFLFTDRHAYLRAAQYYNDLDDLNQIDWSILREHDFKTDPEDPDKKERYQAEALVYRHLPTDALLGVVCYDDGTATRMKEVAAGLGVGIKVITRPQWYF